jgi:hypothetical protein
VNVLVALAVCVLAVTLVLLARALTGYRTQVTNVWWIWWTRVPFFDRSTWKHDYAWQEDIVTRQEASPK